MYAEGVIIFAEKIPPRKESGRVPLQLQESQEPHVFSQNHHVSLINVYGQLEVVSWITCDLSSRKPSMSF